MASFSVGKKYVAVIGTLLIVFFLGACYFFVYIPNNEKTVQERRFRCLQNIDINIHSKIDNSLSQVNGLLTPYNHPGYKDTLNNYLAHYSKDNFTLTPVKEIKDNERLNKDINLTGDSASFITVDSNSRQIELSIIKKLKSAESSTDSSLYSMGIRFGFEQFITPLLPADVFDQYIVFSNKKIVYETFPSGLSYKIKDSLLQARNGITGPGVRSLKIGGTEYKIFSQPVNFGTNHEWIVTGLVSNKNYQKEKNQLPLSIVLLLFTAAIILIVFLPWIKLYQMGNKDKLTILDGVSTLLVAMALMSLMFFVFFKYNFYLGRTNSSGSRNVLADTISSAFTKELSVAYNTLNSFNSVYAKNGRADITKLGSANINIRYSNKKDSIDHNELNEGKELNKIADKISVNQVFWMDANGKEMNNWTVENVNAPHGNFSTRVYFKRIINNKPYWFKHYLFSLDQVTSRTTGIFTSVMAIPVKTDNAKVAAMSFDMKSLINVVMPDGYQFAIIDNNGRVLYHYLADRNLNENLKNEFADSTKLVSSLQAKSDTSFNVEYFGKPYVIKMKPVEGLPYFIVIFEDVSYNDTRDTEVYVFTISMLIGLILFLVIQFIVVFFVSSKRSFFKKQVFETSWVGPKTNSRRQYNQATIGNLVVTALLVVFYNFCSFLEYLYLILFSITFIGIFLNAIFAIKYKEEPYLYRFKIHAIVLLSVFVIVIDAAAFFTLDKNSHFLWLIFFELIITGTCLFFYYLSTAILAIVRRYRVKLSVSWSYNQSFALMATTRLIIASGIPVFLFYTYAYNYEQNISTRYKQLTFANALTQKIPQKVISEQGIDSVKGIYSDGTFIKNIRIDSNIRISTAHHDSLHYTKEDLITVNILSAFRFYRSDKSIKDDNLDLPNVGNRVFFNPLLKRDSGNVITYRQIYRQSGKINKYLVITSSPKINYKLNIILFLIFLILAIVAFYLSLDNLLRKLFALNLPSTNNWGKMDDELLADANLNKLVFIVGSPGSGKLSKLKDKLNAHKVLDSKGIPLVLDDENPSIHNVFAADMILISPEAGEADPDWKACREMALKNEAMVIINHFEYNIKDTITNSIKLNFLEALMQKGKSRIIIISTVHPVNFLNSFNDQAVNSASEGTNAIKDTDLERWHVLLGHFRIVIEPLECSNIPDDAKTMERIIMEETQYTHFLHKMQGLSLKMQPPIKEDDFKAIGAVTDSLIFKLQLTSQYFYTYIWQSLTQEEKFLLYDLAEDGLVNSYDEYNLSMLICKGLIIRVNGTLTLFNKGFRNFILTSIGTAEVNRIKKLVKDTGNWGNLKTPLMLAILAILAFLFASQQEAYSSIITYITALGAGLSGVFKLFSMIGNNNPQKAS